MSVYRTIGPAGGTYDYSSIQTWEAGEQQDLVVNNHAISEALCYSMEDGVGTGDWMIDGWTTDATHRIVIRAAAGHEHNGQRGAGFRINSNQFFVFEDYVDIRDICIQAKLITGMASTSGFLFERVLALKGFYWGGGTGTLTDSICIGNATDDAVMVEFNWSAPTATIENVTAIGGPYGIRRSSALAMHIRNCYAYGATAAYGGTFDTFTKCASADATGSEAALQNIAYSTVNFISITAGSEDLHLTAGSSLIDVGADLGVNRYDIDRDARSAPFDIGADELINSGITLNVDSVGPQNSVSIGFLPHELLVGSVDSLSSTTVPSQLFQVLDIPSINSSSSEPATNELLLSLLVESIESSIVVSSNDLMFKYGSTNRMLLNRVLVKSESNKVKVKSESNKVKVKTGKNRVGLQ